MTQETFIRHYLNNPLTNKLGLKTVTIFIETDNYVKSSKLVVNYNDNFYVLKFPITCTFYKFRGEEWTFTITFHALWIGRDDSYQIPF